MLLTGTWVSVYYLGVDDVEKIITILFGRIVSRNLTKIVTEQSHQTNFPTNEDTAAQ